MEIIQIGSIAILQRWLLLGSAVLFGLVFIKIWLWRLRKGESKKQFDLLLNTLFIGFLIWKGSIFLFEPSLIWKSLFSLVYFTGGSNGLALAIIFSIIYYIFKAKRQSISNLIILQTGFVFTFVVLSSYHILAVVFQENNKMFHFLLGSVILLILIFGLINRNRLTAKRIFSNVILFAFTNLILSFIFIDTVNRLFIFSAEQWLYIGLIIFSLINWDKK